MAEIYMFDMLAGRLWEKEPRGYAFAYDEAYCKMANALPITPLMPL